MGWHNVVAGGGLELALVGMLVVFCGLALVSLYLAAMPGLLAQLDRARGLALGRRRGAAAAPGPADAALVAVIACVVQLELEAAGLFDEQRITIRRGEAPDPWEMIGKMRTLSTRL